MTYYSYLKQFIGKPDSIILTGAVVEFKIGNGPERIVEIHEDFVIFNYGADPSRFKTVH